MQRQRERALPRPVSQDFVLGAYQNPGVFFKVCFSFNSVKSSAQHYRRVDSQPV